MILFVRYGPEGRVVGPFEHRHAALAWLERHGYERREEGLTFRIYEAKSPHETERP